MIQPVCNINNCEFMMHEWQKCLGIEGIDSFFKSNPHIEDIDFIIYQR